MGSSTRTLQSVIDYLRPAGDLAPQGNVAGYALAPLLAIGDDVMSDILGERFNWKFNSYKIAPFYTNSWQQDYPSVNETSIGWLEHCTAVDINNTALPKPKWWPQCVRDLDPCSFQQSPPTAISWEYNVNLQYGDWPGAAMVYTSPIGAMQIPTNPPTAFLDTNGNILLLTTYGTTGNAEPAAAAASAPGVTVADGSCVWSVCDPNGQGFRLGALPPQQGVVYKLFPVAQKKPIPFTRLSQTLDPLPDDYANVFRAGYKAYSYGLSPDAKMRAQQPQQVAMWQATIEKALKKGDREAENKGFVPEFSVAGQGYGQRIGPADPYRRGW